MANILVALGADEDFVSGAESRFDALPSIADFNRGMEIDDLPGLVAERLGDQFAQSLLSAAQQFVFGVADLPQTGLDRDFEFRWDGAKRLGRRVAHQYLGPGVERVTLKGTIYPPQFGSFEAFELMRTAAIAGKPLTFVTGYGRYAGIWCIHDVKDTQTHYLPNGYPRKVEFTIDLVHYGQDSMSFGSPGAALGTDDTVISNALGGGVSQDPGNRIDAGVVIPE
jgi:hypothetical protein